MITKIDLIQQMHNIFITEEDMLLVQQQIEALLKENGIKFKEPRQVDACFLLIDITDIARCFFNALFNHKYCYELSFFAVTCEAYMDFSPFQFLFVTRNKAA